MAQQVTSSGQLLPGFSRARCTVPCTIRRWIEVCSTPVPASRPGGLSDGVSRCIWPTPPSPPPSLPTSASVVGMEAREQLLRMGV